MSELSTRPSAEPPCVGITGSHRTTSPHLLKIKDYTDLTDLSSKEKEKPACQFNTHLVHSFEAFIFTITLPYDNSYWPATVSVVVVLQRGRAKENRKMGSVIKDRVGTIGLITGDSSEGEIKHRVMSTHKIHAEVCRGEMDTTAGRIDDGGAPTSEEKSNQY
jgi:hypothetical protein